MLRIFFIISVIFFQSLICFAQEGLLFEDERLHSGKADLHYLHTETTDEYNTIWWSPVFKGGWGTIHYDATRRTEYGGGYISPFLPKDGKGELILGFLEFDKATNASYEFQGEYRLPSGLGLGGGFVSQDQGNADVEFGKVSFREKWADWQYILETQYQETGNDGSEGGYGALYNDVLMFTYGHDGEQWRSTFGCIAPKGKSAFRPVIELFYVDNSIGSIDGNKSWLINSSLKFEGGFLSHASRLGRAMGPTGIEFANPLGFLSPTWNRRLDVWELGGLWDFRLERIETSAGSVTEKYETLAFPFQFYDYRNPILDSFYAGGFYLKDSTSDDSDGIIGGLFGKLGFLQASVGGDYNFDTSEKRVIIGVIDKF